MNFDNTSRDKGWLGSIVWVLVDIASSAYSLLMTSAVFPIYVRNVVFHEENYADLIWGGILGSTLLIAGMLSPMVGVLADYPGSRRRLFNIFTLTTISTTACLGMVSPSHRWVIIFFFVIANVAFGLAETIYDSFLSHITIPSKISGLSGLGWGVGYLGGIGCLLITYPLLIRAENSSQNFYMIVFIIVASFYLVFALPSMFFLPAGESPEGASQLALTRLWQFWTKTTKNRLWKIGLQRFFVTYLFILIAIAGITYFTPLYATSTLKLDLSDVAKLLLLMQLIGAPSTIIFGYLGNRYGIKEVFIVTLIIWVVDVLLLARASNWRDLLIITVITGLVIGSTKSLARAWLGLIAGTERTSEIFGFGSLVNKLSMIIAPLHFAVCSYVSGSQRVAVGSFALFVFIGLFLSVKVPTMTTQ